MTGSPIGGASREEIRNDECSSRTCVLQSAITSWTRALYVCLGRLQPSLEWSYSWRGGKGASLRPVSLGRSSVHPGACGNHGTWPIVASLGHLPSPCRTSRESWRRRVERRGDRSRGYITELSWWIGRGAGGSGLGWAVAIVYREGFFDRKPYHTITISLIPISLIQCQSPRVPPGRHESALSLSRRPQKHKQFE